MAQILYNTIDAQNTGVVIVAKGTPCELSGWYITNQATSWRWVKIYNTWAGTLPAATTDTPALVLGIPPGLGANAPPTKGGDNHGIDFSGGMAIRCTTGVINSDNTGPTANDVVVNLFGSAK